MPDLTDLESSGLAVDTDEKGRIRLHTQGYRNIVLSAAGRQLLREFLENHPPE